MIDCGSYECRAGWSWASPQENTDDCNIPYLTFRNQIAKPKTLISKEVDAMHIVGDEFAFFDSSKLQRK